MEEISKNQDLLWVERVLSWLPISYFSFAYILFILFILIYIIFNYKNSWLGLSDLYQFLGAYFSSLLIPFEIVAIKIMLDGARERFSYLDEIFIKSQTKFREALGLKILEKRANYLLFLFFVGLPLFFCKFESFPYYDIYNNTTINKENIRVEYYFGLDLYNNLLLIISVYLLCIMIWNVITIYIIFNREIKNLEGRLQLYNLAMLQRKIVPVRNYFLMILILFITCISIFNVSLLTATPATTDTDSGASLQIYISISSMGMLIFFVVVLTLRGLKDAQNIIEKAILEKMDTIDKTIEACTRKINILSDINYPLEKNQFDNLQQIMELQQKEWEKITQEKTGLNLKESLKEAGAFVVSILIPIISFMISK